MSATTNEISKNNRKHDSKKTFSFFKKKIIEQRNKSKREIPKRKQKQDILFPSLYHESRNTCTYLYTHIYKDETCPRIIPHRSNSTEEISDFHSSSILRRRRQQRLQMRTGKYATLSNRLLHIPVSPKSHPILIQLSSHSHPSTIKR